MKRNLKITILGINYSPEATGNAPYTSSLAEGLSGLGHEVRVITGYPHYPEWSLRDGYSGWRREEVINGIPVDRLRHHVPRSPSPISRLHMELSFGLRLFFAKWHKPDVLLLVSPALVSCALAVLRTKITANSPATLLWIQDLYSRGVVETGSGGGTAGKLASFFESKILHSVDGIAAIHDRFKVHMVRALGVNPQRIRVIRNWTHLPAAPTDGIPEMRARLGWHEDEIVVLHAGNMGKKQGLENVIEAAKVAADRGSAVRFVLMGDGNQRKNLEMQAKGIPSLEFVDALPSAEFQLALAAADILLVNELPGVKDMAVPSKLTSYFNSGTPVLAATDEESVTASELQNASAGLRVDAADPLALVLAAEELGGNREARQRLGANGLRFRHETLSEAAAVTHYDEFISNLALSRGR